jgi:phosphoglycolate phosphatase
MIDRMGRSKWQGRRADAFIFDLDGTLVDSGRDIATSGNFVRTSFGLPELPIATVIGYVGDGTPTLVSRLLSHAAESAPRAEPSDEDLRRGLEIFHDHYGRHCLDHTRPYPEVVETLAHFRRLPLAVATNKPRAFTEQILEALRLRPAFRRVVSGDDLRARKPDPAMLRAALEGLDVAPARVAVVGDGPNDMIAAGAFGALAVGAAYGLAGAAALRASGADLLIDHFAVLQELFPSRPEETA